MKPIRVVRNKPVSKPGRSTAIRQLGNTINSGIQSVRKNLIAKPGLPAKKTMTVNTMAAPMRMARMRKGR